MKLALTSVGMTHVGMVRERNEDRWEQMPERAFYVLADGMGGHRAGDVAADVTVESLCDYVRQKFPTRVKGELTPEWAADHLKEGIELANQKVLARGREEPSLRGMGATVCCLVAAENSMVYAHVGDSRVYLFRENGLLQLTEDHSLLNQLIHKGTLSEEGAAKYLYKNIITRAVGTRRQIVADAGQVHMESDDLFLVCSDGLTDLVPDEMIAKILAQFGDLKECAEHLIEAACQAGGQDNITVVLVKVAHV